MRIQKGEVGRPQVFYHSIGRDLLSNHSSSFIRYKEEPSNLQYMGMEDDVLNSMERTEQS